MPGVNVRTATRSGPVNPVIPPAGRYFVTGVFAYGRTDVGQRVRSLAELEILYGTRQAWTPAYDDLRTFFEEGGTDAYVARVVGPAATKATVNLKDQAAGAGLNTIRLDAISPGSWGAGLHVTVYDDASPLDPPIQTGEVRIVVRGPLGSGSVETYDHLTSPAAIVTALNDSQFIRATNLGSATAAPDNLPRAVVGNLLIGGTDDRAGVSYVELGNAHELFGPELGAGVMACPGGAVENLVALWEESAARDVAHACRRLFLGSLPVGSSSEDYIEAAEFFTTEWDDEYVGLFGPWVRIPVGGGVTKLVSPEGYVAACRARAIREGGPWIAPAGERAIARFVLGTEFDVNRETGDEWDAAGVSAIRTIAGTTRLYGWRALSRDLANYALLNGRDVLNVVAVELETRLERYVFQTIDSSGRLYASVAGECIGVLDPMRLAGGLYASYAEDGTQVDPGYSVDTGPTVNTIAVIQANTVAVVCALRVSPVGTLIDVTIVKAGLTATV